MPKGSSRVGSFLKPRIFVSQPIPEKGMALLRKHFDVEANPAKKVLPKNELAKKVKGKDGLLCILTDTVDAMVLRAEPKLRIVSNFGAGFNNIDVADATALGIAVTNTPDVLTEATADYTLALILAAGRRVVEGDRAARAGKFTGWEPEYMLGQGISGKTLGIAGLGRIGKEVAKRAINGFGMRAIYTDIARQEDFEKESGAGFRSLEELLKESDFISLHVALTEKTKHLIGSRELGLMKPTACLINMSRGPVVDETALIKALKGKKIFAAALDVYENEPEIPAELQALENIILSPHLGSATVETREAMSVLAAQNLIDFFSGRTPKTIVNREVITGRL